jgi:hypothetical protein
LRSRGERKAWRRGQRRITLCVGSSAVDRGSPAAATLHIVDPLACHASLTAPHSGHHPASPGQQCSYNRPIMTIDSNPSSSSLPKKNSSSPHSPASLFTRPRRLMIPDVFEPSKPPHTSIAIHAEKKYCSASPTARQLQPSKRLAYSPADIDESLSGLSTAAHRPPIRRSHRALLTISSQSPLPLNPSR